MQKVLLLNAVWLTEKQQFDSFWFDSTRTRTHDLPDSRRTRLPLHQHLNFKRKRSYNVNKLDKNVVKVNMLRF
jgi:hypothetical protein